MAGVTDPAPPPSPGERRLDHPPSDRYRDAESGTGPGAAGGAGATTSDGGSVGRALVAGLGAALAGAIGTIILGGALSVSAGLLVVAGVTGWAIAMATRWGVGASVASDRRPWLAVGAAIVSVILGQVGLWLYARTEGGVLTLPDYLGETWGILVPIQAVIVIVTAWWTAR
jgi:hypothetical protein